LKKSLGRLKGTLRKYAVRMEARNLLKIMFPSTRSLWHRKKEYVAALLNMRKLELCILLKLFLKPSTVKLTVP
jgi:hypothetical protein